MGAIVSRLYEAGMKNNRYILAASGSIIFAIGVAEFQRRQDRLHMEGCWSVGSMEGERGRASMNKRDVVYLIILPRLGVVPNISPFAIKLETWFRMKGIPHEVVESNIPSSKKAFPYAYLNGEEIPDSNFILKRVSEHFNIKVDENLTDAERGISVAFRRMLEENIFLTYICYRYLAAPDAFWKLFTPREKLSPMGKGLTSNLRSFKKSVGMKIWWHGMGRHSREEVCFIAETDLKSVSAYLGDKDFFMGKEPTSIDCVIWASCSDFVIED